MPKLLSAHELLPPSALLTLTTIERTEAGWTVRAQGPDHARRAPHVPANVVIRLIAYALGGRPGDRLARRIGLSVSNDTLLRWVKRCAQPTTAEARVIGIDEWAKRKGHTYGTPSWSIWNDTP